MVKKTTIKKYTPSSKEKYMCAKHKKFFTDELLNWKKDIIVIHNIMLPKYKFFSLIHIRYTGTYIECQYLYIYKYRISFSYYIMFNLQRELKNTRVKTACVSLFF